MSVIAFLATRRRTTVERAPPFSVFKVTEPVVAEGLTCAGSIVINAETQIRIETASGFSLIGLSTVEGKLQRVSLAAAQFDRGWIDYPWTR